MLTHARLLELVHYDPATGIFTARVARKQVKVGEQIGSLNGRGYLQCRILNKHYRLHRLAWFYVTGQWPVGRLDHRNRKKADNRWRNLREATPTQNIVNSDSARGKAGLRGVKMLAPRKDGSPRYVAQMQVKGVKTHLGTFDSAEEAYAVYARASQAAYGQFAEHL